MCEAIPQGILMQQTEKDFEHLCRLLSCARSDPDPMRADELFKEAEVLGRRLHAVEPENAEYCYAIALTYYHRSGTNVEHAACIEWLKKTEERQPGHPWVPLYLGYQYYDDQRYAEAFEQFARVDQLYFAALGQHWRNLKTKELLLVSRLHKSSAPVKFADLKQLIEQYAATKEADRTVPKEIVKTLADTISQDKFDAAKKDVAAEVCRLIRICNCESLFSKEMKIFKAI